MPIRSSLPKGQDGVPLGKLVEIEYDVVDLPSWDFDKLVGGTVLRLALGILHKMTGGTDDEFPDALLPLREILDGEQQIELTKELMQFVDKAFKSHNRRLDAATVRETLRTVFQAEEQTMIKSIFDEKYDEGYAMGVAKGKAGGKAEAGRNVILTVLRANFHRIPKETEKTIRQMTDPVALNSWAVHAATCQSMSEFVKALK